MQDYKDFEALHLFLEICKIPHASFKTQRLQEFLVQKAREFGAKVECDKAGNILCSKGNPKICLQGHYDMVYVGASQDFSIEPEIIYKENKAFLCAKNSSLGADNGAALACMLLALRDKENIACLLTNDEEVGMVGANHIELAIQTPFMLNCDSEDIDEVVYSCAGGYDLECKKHFKKQKIPKNCDFFILETQGFKGGHSGIEIHKNIPNAIIALAKIARKLLENGAFVVEFSGGEKRNSIAVSARLCVGIPKDNNACCMQILQKENFFNIMQCDQKDFYFEAKSLCDAILSLENGVIKSVNDAPILSSNIGILRQSMQGDFIESSLYVMGRGNVESLMHTHSKKEKQKLENLGFYVEILDFYSPWEREDSKLLEIVLEVYKKRRKNAVAKGIHAGLECGILKQKYPHMQFVSIGPSIAHPHSVSEVLDLESFVEFSEILKEILERF